MSEVERVKAELQNILEVVLIDQLPDEDYNHVQQVFTKVLELLSRQEADDGKSKEQEDERAEK